MSLPLAILLVLYAAVVIGLGIRATRTAGSSPEEYFLAGRRLGTVVLFMALFGTNATAFVLVGIPGRAYHDGIGVFGLNAPIIALGIPMTFWLIGSPARRMGARLGALTPVELFRKRLDSRGVGYLLFAAYVVFTIPYMVTAIKGASLTLAGVTNGGIPEWSGAAGVVLVALLYTTLGGMRATAWTNVLQGGLFIVFMVVAFFFMANSLGGWSQSIARVAEHNPALLALDRTKGLYTPGGWTSWSLAISLTVIGFPHMLVRLMAGKDEDALRGVARMYPIALALLWLPAVMIGVWGAMSFPGLEGRASDKIFSLMSSHALPAWLSPFGFLAVLAAVMSTLDAQILTLSSMLVRDVLPPSDHAARDVRAGRIFGALIAAFVYVLALVWKDSVFAIAGMAFSGYVTLTPTLLLAVRWPRFNRGGAILSIVLGTSVLGAGFAGWFPLLGFLPVFWGLAAAIGGAVIGTRLGRPVSQDTLNQAFGPRTVPSSQ